MNQYSILTWCLSSFGYLGSLTTSIKDVVLCDADTEYESWMQIIYKCQDNGLYDVGLELLAAVTVLQAIRKASETITK